MANHDPYTAASIKTANDLRSIAMREKLRDLSSLSLPEIESVVNRIGQLVPAGNVPAMIFSGLARLTERKPPADAARNNVALLFKGVEQMLDKAAYMAFFAGPAAVIWAYQGLLKMSGRNPDDSFPEGTWQFYVDYALREDTARHANETHGFDTTLADHGIKLGIVDRITAWVMAAIHCLEQYDALLANEWYERVATYALAEATRNMPNAARYAQVYRDWERVRPYTRDSDTNPGESYPTYRRHKFERFLRKVMRDLPETVRWDWQGRMDALDAGVLSDYQRQMSILAYLEPGSYGEARTPLALQDACIGVIYKEHYYLIPVCRPGRPQPAHVSTVRGQVAGFIEAPSDAPPAELARLAGVRRAALAELRHKFGPDLLEALNTLRRAPILINFDAPSHDRPLSEIRQAERGVGDHPLTIFDAGRTFVFDQSHIFFDGAWGAALAEMTTNEAIAWAVYLYGQPRAMPGPIRLGALSCAFIPEERALVEAAPCTTPEVCVENDGVDLEGIDKTRARLRQRSQEFKLTVNDLLVLYRAVHNLTYRADPDLAAALRALADQPGAVRAAALAALTPLEGTRLLNPAILLPIDASRRNPRDRVYPMCFEIPLAELDIVDLHRRTVHALKAHQEHPDDSSIYEVFYDLRGEYLSALAGFGRVFSQAKAVAVQGETASIGTIKLLANMPRPLQQMLAKIPDRFEALNDIIKGREVFSNVGAVVPSSTLSRFTTAKDDNEKKALAWGVLTDAEGTMHITLRDFRPHVALLIRAGRVDLAKRIAQDYLDAYVNGLNAFTRQVRLIAETRRSHEVIALAD
ncbi:MAG: hypothetical protein JXB47_04815 [Anaerolineae bacterium]|nr:hypothetical protein [Anaerolineae bacterium]